MDFGLKPSNNDYNNAIHNATNDDSDLQNMLLETLFYSEPDSSIEYHGSTQRLALRKLPSTQLQSVHMTPEPNKLSHEQRDFQYAITQSTDTNLVPISSLAVASKPLIVSNPPIDLSLLCNPLIISSELPIVSPPTEVAGLATTIDSSLSQHQCQDNPCKNYVYLATTNSEPTCPPSEPSSSCISSTGLTTLLRKENIETAVNQFASLASQLGISLPTDLLSSLTDSSIKEVQQRKMDSVYDKNNKIKKIETQNITPSLRQAQNTAEAAIATVAEQKKKALAENELIVKEAKSERPIPHRRKKKPRLEDSEAKLNRLREENQMLKRYHGTMTNNCEKFNKERKEVEAKMRNLVNMFRSDRSKDDMGKDITSLEKELHNTIRKYSETYSDYGRNRQEELKFHLAQLEKLASPTIFTKMSLWTLGQKESFFLNPKGNPVAGILQKELNITPEQGRKLLMHREKIRKVCNNIKNSRLLIAKLNALCEYKHKVFKNRMSKCQEILTPLQVIKLLLWIDDHSQGSERMQNVTSPYKK